MKTIQFLNIIDIFWQNPNLNENTGWENWLRLKFNSKTKLWYILTSNAKAPVDVLLYLHFLNKGTNNV